MSFDNLHSVFVLSACCLLQVIVYCGAGINGKKVAEYGGNSFGYGSRSVLGSGWPKDLVKVGMLRETNCLGSQK